MAYEEHAGPHISLKAETLFSIGDFPVTNSLALTIVLSLGLIIGGIALRKRFSLVPTKIQNLAEYAIESLLDLMQSVLGDRNKAERYLPLIATIFLFVLIANWSGLVPGLTALTLETHEGPAHLLRAPSSDLNFTLALALITVIAINGIAIATLGIRSHLGKFFNFSSPIGFFIGILELVSEFARIVSFSFRLFGNVFAGEVLLIVVSFLIPYAVPLPFLGLEVLVGFVQAFVFAMLALVFIAVATTEHAEHANEHKVELKHT